MKSRAIVRNYLFQILKRGESAVVTDPKGEMFRDTYEIAKANKYKVKVFNTDLPIHADNSDGELGNFAPVVLPASTSTTVQTMNHITEENAVNITEVVVADALQTQIENSAPANDKQKPQFITIDPATTPIPTVQDAEDYTIEGNGQYKGYKLGAIFRLAASGDKTATGWLNWLSTAITKSENIAWAKFYADFLRNYYTQEANKVAQNSTTNNKK